MNNSEPRRLDFAGAAEDARNHSSLDEDLNRLGEFDRPFAAGLHAGEKLVVDSFVAAQSFAKNIGGGDGLLNRD